MLGGRRVVGDWGRPTDVAVAVAVLLLLLLLRFGGDVGAGVGGGVVCVWGVFGVCVGGRMG